LQVSRFERRTNEFPDGDRPYFSATKHFLRGNTPWYNERYNSTTTTEEICPWQHPLRFAGWGIP